MVAVGIPLHADPLQLVIMYLKRAHRPVVHPVISDLQFGGGLHRQIILIVRTELEIPNLSRIRELILGDELLALPGVPLQDVVFEGGGDEACP